MFGAPPPPKTVLEALNQRLDRYRSDESKAKSAGDASRARRLGRICKQYEDAIKLHNAGRPIPVNELPTPPGYGPFPPTQSASSAQSGKTSAPSPGAQASPAKATGSPTSPCSVVGLKKDDASRPMSANTNKLSMNKAEDSTGELKSKHSQEKRQLEAAQAIWREIWPKSNDGQKKKNIVQTVWDDIDTETYNLLSKSLLSKKDT